MERLQIRATLEEFTDVDSCIGFCRPENIERLLEAITGQKDSSKRPLTVMYVGIDDFMKYAATGHKGLAAQLLMATANIVTDNMRTRKECTYIPAMSREGEFIVVINGLNQGQVNAYLTHRIKKAFDEGYAGTASISIGVAEYDGKANARELIERAKSTMEYARQKRSGIALYTPAVERAA